MLKTKGKKLVVLLLCVVLALTSVVSVSAADHNKVSTTTTKKTTTRKIRLAKASTVTKTKNLGTTTKSSSSTKVDGYSKKTTKITKKTNTKEAYTKGSSYKVRTTTVTTTTTVTRLNYTSTKVTTASRKVVGNTLADAFEKCGFKIKATPGVQSYTGYFSAKTKEVLLIDGDSKDDTFYHEFGHFVAFLAGNKDTKSEFKNIYNAEKSKFKQVDRIGAAYATSSSKEFFAECYKLYVTKNSGLKKYMPKTYNYIKKTVSGITPSQINKMVKICKYIK